MNITVYLGSSIPKDNKYVVLTKKVGEWIAQNNHRLIYGGASSGLMGILADTVLENGGQVTGVMAAVLKGQEELHPGLTETIMEDTMLERKQVMIDKGDAYIALPGGPGTLEEIAEVISLMRILANKNPCILVNLDGYYDSLQAQFQKMVEEGFMDQASLDMILFAKNLSEVKDFINSYDLLFSEFDNSRH